MPLWAPASSVHVKSVRESSSKKAAPRAPESHEAGRASEQPAATGPTSPSGEATQDLAPVVGGNLRRLRMRRGLSLEKLAQNSGVSRAMLGQIELGQSAPTINVLWKIARALDVTFATLIQAREAGGPTVLKKAQAKVLTSHGGQLQLARALSVRRAAPRRVLRAPPRAARAQEAADAHAPGTLENLVVSEGQLELVVGEGHASPRDRRRDRLRGRRRARLPNAGAKECVMYLVMTYAERAEVGASAFADEARQQLHVARGDQDDVLVALEDVRRRVHDDLLVLLDAHEERVVLLLHVDHELEERSCPSSRS